MSHGDLMCDEIGFREKLRQIVTRAPCDVPLDSRLFRLDQHAQRRLLRIGLCELIRGELVRQDRFVLLVGGIRRLEIDDSPLSVEVRDEVESRRRKAGRGS